MFVAHNGFRGLIKGQIEEFNWTAWRWAAMYKHRSKGAWRMFIHRPEPGKGHLHG